jgi:hypothetical protein
MGGGSKSKERSAVKKINKNVHNELQWLLDVTQGKRKLKHCMLRCTLTENEQKPNCFQQRIEARNEDDLSSVW